VDYQQRAERSRAETRRPQRPSSYDGVKVTKKTGRDYGSRNSGYVSRHDRRPNSSSRGNGAARAIASILFFPFSLAFGHHRHPTIYISRPSYYYPYHYSYYYYSPYYYSPLYYGPYWWQESPKINYNTYNSYTYIQGDQTSQTSNAAGYGLENIKLQGARFIDNPRSAALTITNETQYTITEIVFAFVFRGSDFTEIIENVSWYLDTPLAQYEKRFMRIDLSGVEFQTPENFSVVAIIQSITTDGGQIISDDRQLEDYNQEN
jgi:hypothetical protein